MESGSIHFSMGEPFTVTSGKTGSYKMKLKLFGLFELKNISIDVIDNMSTIFTIFALTLNTMT